jgi:ferredoxin-NADP reductase
MGGPLCLIAAGSGIAPIMAMLRHRDRQISRVSAVLLHSSRNLEDVIYRKELDAMASRDSDLRMVRRSQENSRRDGRAIGEGLTSRCWPTRAFRPTEIQRHASVALLLSSKTSQGFWSSLDMTLLRSRRSDSGPPEVKGND